VSLSQSRSLAIANPDWLRQQRFACNLSALGFLTLAAAVIAMIVGVSVGQGDVWLYAPSCVAAVAMASMLLAWWRLAMPQPNQPPEQGVIARSIVRGGVTLFVSALLLLLAVGASRGREPEAVFIGTLTLAFLAAIIQAACLDRARLLMRRSQQRRLHHLLGVSIFICAGGSAFLLAGCVAVTIAIGNPFQAPDIYFLSGYVLRLGSLAGYAGLLWRATARRVESDRIEAARAWSPD
jgi:hypothetical protein